MNVFKTSLLATALIAGGAIAPAHAADNATFLVEIDIEGSCDVTTTDDVVFLTQAATPGTVGATGEVTVQCTRNLAYDVKLDGGQNSGNDINARQMLHEDGVETIAYQLYQDAGHAAIWGETTGVDGDTKTGIGTGFGSGAPYDQPLTVHAQATIVGDELVGAYEDTIKATVVF